MKASRWRKGQFGSRAVRNARRSIKNGSKPSFINYILGKDNRMRSGKTDTNDGRYGGVFNI